MQKTITAQKSNRILKLVVLSMLVAVGVVISPLLRVEGMCPMAHCINIICSALLGPWYSLACAVTIGIIRMAVMGIPPIALTGAVFGAFLSGVLYRMSKGNLLLAVLGEVIGTGIIGAIVSYPVMTLFWGKEGLTLLFYVPSFICGTLIGGSIGFVFLKRLAKTGVLKKLQTMLGTTSYAYRSSIFGNALTVAAFGVIGYVVIQILRDMFRLASPVWAYLSYAVLALFLLAGLVYWIYKSVRRTYES